MVQTPLTPKLIEILTGVENTGGRTGLGVREVEASKRRTNIELDCTWCHADTNYYFILLNIEVNVCHSKRQSIFATYFWCYPTTLNESVYYATFLTSIWDN
jgi:hypothetical protein